MRVFLSVPFILLLFSSMLYVIVSSPNIALKLLLGMFLMVIAILFYAVYSIVRR